MNMKMIGRIRLTLIATVGLLTVGGLFGLMSSSSAATGGSQEVTVGAGMPLAELPQSAGFVGLAGMSQITGGTAPCGEEKILAHIRRITTASPDPLFKVSSSIRPL